MSRNILKDFPVDNMEKTKLDGKVYEFFVNYNAIDIRHIVDINKYFMKKLICYKYCLDISNQYFFYNITFGWSIKSTKYKMRFFIL